MPLKILNDKLVFALVLGLCLSFWSQTTSLVTSNIKGLLVGGLFWLYHRLLYANEVISFIATDDESQTNKQTNKQKKIR